MPKHHVQSPQLGRYARDHVTQWAFLSACVVLLLSWGVLVWFVRPSEVPILLRYNVYLNFDLQSLVPWYKAFGIPLMALIFLLVNAIISFLLFRKGDVWASYILLVGGFCVQLAAFVSVIAIVLVNR